METWEKVTAGVCWRMVKKWSREWESLCYTNRSTSHHLKLNHLRTAARYSNRAQRMSLPLLRLISGLDWGRAKHIPPQRVMDRLWPCYYANSLKLFEICLLSTTIRTSIIAVAILAAQWLCELLRFSRMCSSRVPEISRMSKPITTAVKMLIRARLLTSRYTNAGGLKTEVLCLYKIPPMMNKSLTYESCVHNPIRPQKYSRFIAPFHRSI